MFVLYAEDRGLLPVEHPTYARGLSILSLFEELQSDHGAYPDSMARRFGAWGRLVTLFRAVFLGVSHGDLQMPPRRGSLFDPHTYPFLEGWGPAGGAPITQAEDRAAARLPSVDDQTVFRVLEKLLVFEGQRLSYRALDVEQIGSVYEALMGYHVVRTEAPAVCMRPDRLWVTVEEVLAVPAARRSKWIKETIGLTTAQAQKLGDELGDAADAASALDALAKFAAGGKAERDLARAKVGQLVLQPGTERRRTSSHYTPRSLSAPIVRRTIEPLLAVMGEAPASERILRLKICDPAMGSGAFLVEACRFLADHVLAAWTREREPDGTSTLERMAREHGGPLLHARRLVAQRCLYGVDKNEAAVELAKLSLWLVTLSKTLPFTFLDHAFRHGDSLVGLDFDQLRAFHWKPPADEAHPKKKRAEGVLEGQLSLFGREIDVALSEAIALRQKIGELGDAPLDDREKERLLWDAQDALDRVRLIGDVLVGAFFAHDKERDRENERLRREDLVRGWLGSGGPPTDELGEMQRDIRARLPVFHWMVEFPEVFYADRPDPLEADHVNRAAYMDAFVGNPPFADKNALSATFGEVYIRWLLAQHVDSHGNADITAHFFRRAASLLGTNGTLGLIATNTIAQGDTRATGLRWLLQNRWRIIDATTSFKWPGTANVAVAVVHAAIGSPTARIPLLDGRQVAFINSQLHARAERADATPLNENRSLWFQGAKVYGSGFQVQPAEYYEFIRNDSSLTEVLRPYIGGEELNSNPRQQHERYVVNFGQHPLDVVSSRWPQLLRLVEQRVRPERELARVDTADGAHRKKYWWQFAQPRPELFRAIAPLRACIAAARVTKHAMFTFQPVDRVFSEQVNIFVFDTFAAFAVLQSRVHEPWARLLSSSMRNDLRYSASECFETFPFPKSHARAVLPALEDVGKHLYNARAEYMLDENVGLTVTYNRLKDPTCAEQSVLELRALHEKMDVAVVAAYAENDPDGGWSAIDVPPFCPLDAAGTKKLEVFEDAVIDRLFALNARRADDEKQRGLRATSVSRAKKDSDANSSHHRPTEKTQLTANKSQAVPLQVALPISAAASAPTPPAWDSEVVSAVGTAVRVPVTPGRWTVAQTGIELGIHALAAVLRSFGRPATRDEVEHAVVLTLLPRLLLSTFDKKARTAWRKVIGADNLATPSIASLSIPWGGVLKRAATDRLLVVAPGDMWVAGPDIRDAPSPALDARALVAAAWLAHAPQTPEAELESELAILRAAS